MTEVNGDVEWFFKMILISILYIYRNSPPFLCGPARWGWQAKVGKIIIATFLASNFWSGLKYVLRRQDREREVVFTWLYFNPN